MKFLKPVCICFLMTLIGSVTLPMAGESSGEDLTQPSCSEQPSVFIGNPAASYCVDVMGYAYQTLTQDDGSQTGQCLMPTGEVCDQWAFYGGTCGVEHAYCSQMGMTLESRSDGSDPYSQIYAVCIDEDKRSLVHISDLVGFDVNPLSIPTTDTESRSEDLSDLTEEDRASLPTSFDWRNVDGENWMTPVKNQGPCGSCWAFSAVGIVEPYYNFLNDQPNLNLDLSEENLVSDCFLSGSCSGGPTHTALEYIRDTGIVDEACMPYTATNSSCGTMCSNLIRYDIDGFTYKFYSCGVDTLKNVLINNGPVSVYLKMAGVFGSDGIYRCNPLEPNDINHAVVAVGYNDSGQYWIVKNSWGTSASGHDQGYFKVGYNQCNINTTFYAYIPLPEAEPNLAPIGINLCSTSVCEGRPPNTTVGSFTTVDPNSRDTHIYSLVSGAGSGDNAAFSISGNQLKTSLTFERAVKDTYLIRVRSTDQGELFVEKNFTITVMDAGDCSDIFLPFITR